MGYDFYPRNKKIGNFHLGAFSFPILLDECGCLWPCIGRGAQWYCVFGADPRMPQGDNYPRLRSNDGFRVTAEEARILARVARNYVAVQRTLGEEMRWQPGKPEPWPRKIREDFVDKFEQFADWSEKSSGFAIR